MDIFFFLFLPIFIILVILSIPSFLIWIIYSKLKENNHPKAAKLFLGSCIVFISLFLISEIFKDELFSKNDARELLAYQNIELKDDFKILKNESHSGIGEYDHTFILSISAKDKARIISEIKASKNFKVIKNDTLTTEEETKMSDEEHEKRHHNWYFGPVVIENYETDYGYVRTLFEPAQKENFAPLDRTITIYKDKNELRFDDIDL